MSPVIDPSATDRGVLYNTTKDPNGVAVPSLTIVLTLKPGPAYRADTGTEVARRVTTTSDANGYWSVELDQNVNLVPANSYYEVAEPVPLAQGGPITSSVRVTAGSQSVYAARITNPVPGPAEGGLTQTTADARYVRIGDPVTANTTNTFTADQYFGSGRPWYDLNAFAGVDPTGAADSTTGIQAVINLVKLTGGEIRAEGLYKYTTLNFDNHVNGTALVGMGSANTSFSASPATFRCSLVNATTSVTGHSAQGLLFRNIRFEYSSASYTGKLLSFDHSVATPSQDPAHLVFENCYFGGQTTSQVSANSLVHLHFALNYEFRDCIFNRGTYLLRLGTFDGSGGNNSGSVYRCWFGNQQTACIYSSGHTALNVCNSTFENNAAGVGAAYVQDTGYVGTTKFDSNWFGDATVQSTWIAGLKTLGGLICNNQFYGPAANSICLSTGGSQGLTVVGNDFQGLGFGISITSASTGLSIIGNRFGGIATAAFGGANIDSGIIWGNDGLENNMYPLTAAWSTPTGTLSRAVFDQSTVTLPQLAQRVAALITDSIAHRTIYT